MSLATLPQIFDSEKAPEQVEGKRIDSSFLVAPISGISEWYVRLDRRVRRITALPKPHSDSLVLPPVPVRRYWLAPSRLKRLPIAKAAKSYQETNLTYQQKLEEANKQTEYINKLAASPYRTEQGVKLRDMNLELTFLYGLLEGLKVVADENETSTWEEKKLKELQGGQEGGGEEGVSPRERESVKPSATDELTHLSSRDSRKLSARVVNSMDRPKGCVDSPLALEIPSQELVADSLLPARRRSSVARALRVPSDGSTLLALVSKTIRPRLRTTGARLVSI